MSKNKLAKFAELDSFGHVVQVPYNTLENSDFYLKGKWAKAFFKNKNPIILELGCGKGEYSVELAKQNPDINFIGVDIKGARMWNGANEAHANNIKNVGFLRTNIEIITKFFGAEEIAEIWLTFPDPQMRKHTKRLTSTVFLNKYRQFLQAEGIVHLKTDSWFQYNYTSAMVHLNKFEVLAETDNLYESDILNETLQIKTYYEKQWLSRGFSIKYLAFKLHGKAFVETKIAFIKDEYRSFGRIARE